MPSHYGPEAQGLYAAVVTLAVISWCYPWSFGRWWAWVAAHLPLLVFAMTVQYVLRTTPSGDDIRVDVVLLLPVLGGTALAYLVRLRRMCRLLEDRLDRPRDPGPRKSPARPGGRAGL